MWRWLAGGGAGVAMVGAGALLLTGRETPSVAAPPPAPPAAADVQNEPLPDTVPEVTAKTREEKRFGRYDKDKDGRISRDEYLLSRRKAYTKLDRDGDGRLSFDEWAAKTSGKFDGADRDRSGSMDAAEFATTAVKRKAREPAKCPPTAPAEDG